MTEASSNAAKTRLHAARRAARLLAVQTLYQADMGEEEMAMAAVKQLAKQTAVYVDPADPDMSGIDAPDVALAKDIAGWALQSRADIDELISGALDTSWPLHRLDTVLRAVLRAGTAELLHHAQTDAPIIICDYVDVAHAFFSSKEPGMVNGVLDKVAKQIRR